MSETDNDEIKKNATTAKAQKGNAGAPPPAENNPLHTLVQSPKPHRPSNYVTLMPGQSETQSLFASLNGAPVAIYPKHGKVFKLVDEETSDPNTLSRAMGVDLVNKGIFVYTDAPDKDAPPFVEVHDPTTPQGDMVLNGVLSGDNVGTVAVPVNGGKEQVFVPTPFVTTSDGGVIPVAPQPGFTSAELPSVDAEKTE